MRIEPVSGPTHAGLNDMLASLGAGCIEVQASAPVEGREDVGQKVADQAAGGQIPAAVGIEFPALGDSESPSFRPSHEGAEQARADGGRIEATRAEVRP